MNKFIILCMSLFLLIACNKTTILEKAEKRMPIALKQKIEVDFGEFKKMDVRDLKTVYANDSICLLQCYVDLVKKNGDKEILEYRYIYLIDGLMSRFSGKLIYNECVMDFPCMPDDLIKKCQEEVLSRNESVYDDLYSCTFPIKN